MSHSHTSTPGSSPMHSPNVAGLLSPHRAVPSSHHGQNPSPHRLSITGGSASGNGTMSSTTTTTATTTVSTTPATNQPFSSVAIELNEIQSSKRYNFHNLFMKKKKNK